MAEVGYERVHGEYAGAWLEDCRGIDFRAMDIIFDGCAGYFGAGDRIDTVSITGVFDADDCDVLFFVGDG